MSLSIDNGQPVASFAFKLFAGVSLVVFVQVLGSTVYYLLFHPLRRFPGPPLARVSRLWSRVWNFKGCKSERIHLAHLKYGKGPIVRVGPNELSFSDPSAVREIYSSDVFVKDESFYRAKRIFHEDFLLTFRNPEAHKQRRKLLSRGFSQAAMLEYEPYMDSKIAALLDQWTQRTADGSAIDVHQWLHWLGFDIVYHLLFDEDPGSVKHGRPHEVMPYFRAWKPTFIYKEFLPVLERWGVAVPGRIGGYFRDVNAWKKYAEKIIQNCRAQDTKTPFLRHILYGEKDVFLGRPLTDSEIAEECMGGMFGGSGTTANTLVYLLWAASQRPDVVERLKEELRGAFSADTLVPDYKTCASLPFLQATISETLRRYPTIIATLPRRATEGAVLQGVTVPKGLKSTIVGTQNYTIHRSEAAFPNPEQWDPDRWLDKENEGIRKEAWTPFSVGPRKCVGINVAQMELSKVAAALFLHFDASIDSSMDPAEMRMYDTFNAAPVGSKLLLRLQRLHR